METGLVWFLNPISFVIYMDFLLGLVGKDTTARIGVSLQKSGFQKRILHMRPTPCVVPARKPETAALSMILFLLSVTPVSPRC